MNTKQRNRCPMVVLLLTLTVLTAGASAQPRSGPQPVSPEVSADRLVTFRILAPNAQAVRVAGGDMPAIGQGAEMKKGERGVWEVTLGPVDPGSYRYHFNVDGLSVIDPRNPATSESLSNTWSLVNVPGADFMDTKNVPHGAVAEVTYYSNSLKRFRRMHIYTSPGYESCQGKFPVFYLLHGASDSDDSWTSVGRAGFIMDNLIAAGKAKPMVVVMPAGHTGPFNWGESLPGADAFVEDFVKDVMPYVDSHYRVHTDRPNRAVAGLSMGGAQTLTLLVGHMDQFGYAGVFSSGVFELGGRRMGNQAADSGPSWEARNTRVLDDVELKKGLQLLWFATGKEDFLLETSRRTVEVFKKHNFEVVYKETEGAHTWINWRLYLNEFAPLLFKPIATEAAPSL
ncbi:MAG: esterase [Phycisphaerae bacterium]|nr:esterase [Phycisphaerae bacterium]